LVLFFRLQLWRWTFYWDQEGLEDFYSQ
jgi:hypothetical protein